MSNEAEWQLAADGDPLDMARVARFEGALRLLGEVEATSPRGEAALRLLPYAPDAPAHLGQLCRLISGAADEPRTARLASLVRVLEAQDLLEAQAPDQVAGFAACVSVLKQERAGAEGQDLDHIESALQSLEP